MAFNVRALSRYATSDRGRAGAVNLYVYATDDALAAVLAAGYFDAAVRNGLKVGDVIACVAAGQGVPVHGMLTVNTVIGGTVRVQLAARTEEEMAEALEEIARVLVELRGIRGVVVAAAAEVDLDAKAAVAAAQSASEDKAAVALDRGVVGTDRTAVHEDRLAVDQMRRDTVADRDVIADDRRRAEAAADKAEGFDPASYYRKGEADERFAPTGHLSDKNNPHGVTKAQVGLGNVNNTSDADKPISTLQAEALATKANTGDLRALATKDKVGNGDWDSTDLAIANGGTGASTAADALQNLKAYPAAGGQIAGPVSLKPFSLGSMTGGTKAVTFANGSIQEGTLTSGANTLNVTGIPADGGDLELHLTYQAGSLAFTQTVRWLTGAGAKATDLGATGVTLTAGVLYTVILWSAGGSLYGVIG